MGEFIRFYSWGLSMKFHMAVYTLALVFFKAIFNALAAGDAAQAEALGASMGERETGRS